MVEIFGTLGPACARADVIERMFLEGMTGMRLNLSHSGLRESGPLIQNFRQAARRAGVCPEFLIDMQGPEIRIGKLDAPLHLEALQEVEIGRNPKGDSGGMEGNYEIRNYEIRKGVQAQTPWIPVSDSVFAELETGDRLLLDDGKLELVVTSIQPRVAAQVRRGGVLGGKKSLKIVGKQMQAPVLTPQDIENIRLAKDYGVTALMQPFVTDGEQLAQVRREMEANGMGHARLFAKIENREGVKQIEGILPGADMLVIARGDLGNDMPLWQLPAAQKKLSGVCRRQGKPFLVVTELLASMVHNPYPTRAEVSDIFHAVLDGAAAVMVTNETAQGEHPVEVIRYLKKTVQSAIDWGRG